MQEKEAIALYPSFVRHSHIAELGRQPYRTAEKTALQALQRSAGGDAQSDVPVSVSWVEDYGKLQVHRRAVYCPARELLYTQYKETPPTVYRGVSLEGITAALQTDTRAPMAAAQTFSFRTMVEMARFNGS